MDKFTHKGKKYKVENHKVFRRTQGEKPKWVKLSLLQHMTLAASMRGAGK